MEQLMRKIILAALFVFLCSCGARGQAARVDDIIITSFGGALRSGGALTVTVCTIGATGTPCSPKATIYTDATAVTTSANPFTSDSNGNYGFWVLPGTYVVTITGTIPSPYTKTYFVTSPLGIYSNTFAGATPDVRVNACITAAIANQPHICNATNENWTQTSVAQLNVGDTAQDQVTLIVPSGGIGAFNITDGVSCGVKQFGGASIIGFGTLPNNFHFGSATGANMKTMYCNEDSPAGGGSYIRAEGFTVDCRNSATMASGECALFQHLYDNSLVTNLAVLSYQANTDGLVSYGNCCGTNFTNITIAGNHTGGRQLFVKADASARNLSVNFHNISAGHSGSGFCDIEISGGSTAPTDAVNRDIVLDGVVHTEAGTNGTTCGIKVVDARDVRISGWTAGVLANASFTGFDLSQTASDQVRDVSIHSYNFQSGGGTAINNHISGETPVCGTTCYISDYSYGGTNTTQQQIGPIFSTNRMAFFGKFNSTLNGSQDLAIVSSDPVNRTRPFYVRNFSDNNMSMSLDAGLTTAQNVWYGLNDQGNEIWRWQKDNLNCSLWYDFANSLTKIKVCPGVGNGLVIPSTVVGSLPSAASNPGMMITVTDSTAVAAEGQTCVGSSSNKALAFSNGSTWKCF
jgi:hypothetical protein